MKNYKIYVNGYYVGTQALNLEEVKKCNNNNIILIEK